MMNIEKEISVRKAKVDDIKAIHEILMDAFARYRKDYSEEAYRVTVLSLEEINRRLNDPAKLVFVAQRQDEIIGTATIDISANSLYLQSMGVRTDVQRKGIGKIILRTIEKYAREHRVKKIILECYAPLTKAIELYTKFGFKKTGRIRSYYGIKIFEMEKNLTGNDI